MPLKRGTSKATFKANLRKMVRAGNPVKQAVAAAFREKRASAAHKGAKKRSK